MGACNVAVQFSLTATHFHLQNKQLSSVHNFLEIRILTGFNHLIKPLPIVQETTPANTNQPTKTSKLELDHILWMQQDVHQLVGEAKCCTTKIRPKAVRGGISAVYLTSINVDRK